MSYEPYCRGPHRGEEPPYTTDGLCRLCVYRVRRALSALPEDYALLYLALVPGRGAASGALGKVKAASRVPLNLTAEAAMSRIVEVLTAWEESVAARVGLTPRLAPRSERSDGAVVQHACRALDAHLVTLLTLPEEPHYRWDDDTNTRQLLDLDGVGGALEVLRAHGRARAVLGSSDRATRLYGAVCPTCHAAALTESGAIGCDACGATWATRIDYDNAVAEAARPLKENA